MYQINSTEKYKIFNCNARALFLAFVIFTVLIRNSAAQNSTKKESAKKECPAFECGERKGNFADPCQCRRYITCANGAATKRVCPSGLYWDDAVSYTHLTLPTILLV